MPHIEWKMKCIQYTKLNECIKRVWEIFWSFFHNQRTCMRKSAKKTTVTGLDDSENSY